MNRGKGDKMKREEKVDFDLSALTLKELIEVYQNITDFSQFLVESKIELEEENEDE